MADNSILEAKVKLVIDKTSIDKGINDASSKLKNSLQKADGALSKQLSRQLNRDINKLSNTFIRASRQLSNVLKRGLTFGVGLGTSSIFAFLKSGTPEALKFSHSLDKLKASWSRIGQTLATKIKFGGFTGQELLDKLVNKIENLDLSQIQKMVDYFIQIAKIWAGIKIAQGVANVAKLSSTAFDLSASIAKGFAAKLAANVAGNVVGNVAGNVARNAAITGVSAAGGLGTATILGRLFSSKIMNAAEINRDLIKNFVYNDGTNKLYSNFRTGYSLAEGHYLKNGRILSLNKYNQMNLAAARKSGLAQKMFSDPKIFKPGPKTNALIEKYIFAMAKILPKEFSRGWMAQQGVRVLGRVGPVIAAGVSATKDYKENKNPLRAAGVFSASILSGLAGAKIGAMIGTAIAPGIGTAIGGAIGGIAGTIAGTFAAREWLPGKKIEEQFKATAPKIDSTNLFKQSVELLKQYNKLNKDSINLGDKYVSGQIPLEKRKSLINPSVQQIKQIDQEIQVLEAELESFKDLDIDTEAVREKVNRLKETLKSDNITEVFAAKIRSEIMTLQNQLSRSSDQTAHATTLTSQIEKLNQAKNNLRKYIDDTITLDWQQTDDKKAFEEAKAESQKRIDKKIAEDRKRTQKEEDELSGKDKKHTPGRITRGDIENLPDILSDIANDLANDRDEQMLDIQKRQLEIDEDRKAREEEIKEMIDQRNKEVKEYEDKMLRLNQTFSEALKLLTGGSLTVATI